VHLVARHSGARIDAGLLRAGKFTAQELAANRAGRMSPGQRVKLLRGEAALLFLAGIGLVISAAIGPSLLDAWREDWILGAVVTAFFVVCFVMGVGCALLAIAVLRDFVLGKVVSAAGALKLSREGLTTYALARPIPVPYTYPGQYTYQMEIHGVEFKISRELFEILSQQDTPMRVYYSKHSTELLSLEPDR